MDWTTLWVIPNQWVSEYLCIQCLFYVDMTMEEIPHNPCCQYTQTHETVANNIRWCIKTCSNKRETFAILFLFSVYSHCCMRFKFRFIWKGNCCRVVMLFVLHETTPTPVFFEEIFYLYITYLNLKTTTIRIWRWECQPVTHQVKHT